MTHDEINGMMAEHLTAIKQQIGEPAELFVVAVIGDDVFVATNTQDFDGMRRIIDTCEANAPVRHAGEVH